MARRWESFRLLRRGASRLPLRSRVHLLGRFLSCPFVAVVDALPAGGAVLDVGAGHGVLALLAVHHGAPRVVALEPDPRKVGSALRHPAIDWVCGFDGCIAGAFDAVVLCDVLYRVPPPERDGLLARLFERLRPGGVLVIKETDPEARLKSLWNLAQETIAVRLLRVTLGSSLVFEDRRQLAARTERAGFAGFAVREIGAGYPHAHVLYEARRPS
jgi:2-polyprenyl-3-methyl-5-hydroxy-6-metoxy-1,4-benzoquinol methylase